ncbi:unnamed protein product, partial [Nesidiocoris tenuis]
MEAKMCSCQLSWIPIEKIPLLGSVLERPSHADGALLQVPHSPRTQDSLEPAQAYHSVSASALGSIDPQWQTESVQNVVLPAARLCLVVV